MKSLSPNKLASASGGGAVQSVNTQTGAVSLGVEDLDDVQYNVTTTATVYELTYAGTSGYPASGEHKVILDPNTSPPSTDKLRISPTDANGLSVPSFTVGNTVWISADQVNYSTVTATSGTGISSGHYLLNLDASDGAVYDSLGIAIGGTLYLSNTDPDPQTVNPSNGDILQYNSTDSKFKPAQLSTIARSEVSGTTASIADAASADLTITNTGKTGQLLSIETDAAAWVTVYASQATRTADASRTETTDPTAGSGVLAEVITTGAQTVLLTPGATFFNSESTPAGELYLKVVNKSGSSAAIAVTLDVLPIEI